MIRLKEMLNEGKTYRGVTIGDKFIWKQKKREMEVIDFLITKNWKGKVVETVVVATDSMNVKSRHPFASVVRNKI